MPKLKERVLELLEKNLSEPEIIKVLEKEGFKREDIEKIITEILLEKISTLEETKTEERKGEETKTEELKKPTEKIEESLEELKKYIKHEERKEEASLTLFIKLEKYGEILNIIERIKNNVEIIEKNLDLLKDTDKLRAEILENFRVTLSKVVLEIINLDNLFTKPEGAIEEMIPKEKVEDLSKKFEESVKELKRRLENIRESIEKIFLIFSSKYLYTNECFLPSKSIRIAFLAIITFFSKPIIPIVFPKTDIFVFVYFSISLFAFPPSPITLPFKTILLFLDFVKDSKEIISKVYPSLDKSKESSKEKPLPNATIE